MTAPVEPNEAGIDAACAAARKAIEDYSSFDSSMVPDDALRTVVTAALEAYVNTPKGN
jgi:hypothetical protein